MKALPAMVVLLACLSGCSAAELSEFGRKVEGAVFSVAGTTVFLSYPEVELSELHLSMGSLQGSEVVVEAELEFVNSSATHLVLSDDNARLLVVLTGLPRFVLDHPRQPPELEHQGRRARVLGTVEMGQRGLPVLRASSVAYVEAPGKAGESSDFSS